MLLLTREKTSVVPEPIGSGIRTAIMRKKSNQCIHLREALQGHDLDRMPGARLIRKRG
jgi:hypothetical protein